MYTRSLAAFLQKANQNFPVLLVTGPRQVGKTTLLEMCKDEKRGYVTLDDLEARYMAQNDPGLFIQTYPPPLIIDEIQYAPELFSYIKMSVDRSKQNGLFWLTGSQKFQLMKGITESLAGRVAIVDLLGLSQCELTHRAEQSMPFLPKDQWIEKARNTYQPATLYDIYQRIWLGSFPRVYDNPISERDIFYRSYIQTYIQRDIKDSLAISNEMVFHQFLTVLAARTGQLLNYNDIAKDVGVSNNTIKSWISALQGSGLVYLLYPYRTNIAKRLIKTPKLYFLDTGLCAYLTKWSDFKSLEAGAMSGQLLETFIFAEILKSYWHQGIEPYFYYYRDTDQKEIDLLIESSDTLYPIEFKKTATPSKTACKSFSVLQRLGKTIGQGAVICFVERDVPLSRSVIAIPVSYL